MTYVTLRVQNITHSYNIPRFGQIVGQPKVDIK